MATVGEAPLKTGSVESTEAKRRQGTLEPAITKWLLEDMTSSTTAGKQILSADTGIYYDACKKQFPGVHFRELRRALKVARKQLGLVKPRIPSKQKVQSKRQPKQS